MFLFDETAFEGSATRFDPNETIEIAKKKKRWDPIAAGFVCLARVSIGAIREGRGAYGAAWHDVEFNVVGKKGEKGVGRRMYGKMMIAGTAKALKDKQLEAASQVKSALLCYHGDVEAPFDPKRIDGLIVPIVMTQEPVFGSDRIVNGARIICAHPSSRDYGSYLELCRRVGPESVRSENGEIQDRVPGWRLYQNAPAMEIMAKLMAKQSAVDEDGDFELEGEIAPMARREAEIRRILPEARDEHYRAFHAVAAKRERAEEAKGKKSEANADRVLHKALLRVQRAAERVRALEEELDQIEKGGWSNRKSCKAKPTITMTRAQLEAAIARKVPEGLSSPMRAPGTPAPDPIASPPIRPKTMAELMADRKGGVVDVVELAERKRKKEWKDMLVRDQAAAYYRPDRIEARRAEEERAENARRVVDVRVGDQTDSWDLPTDHPDYQPF